MIFVAFGVAGGCRSSGSNVRPGDPPPPAATDRPASVAPGINDPYKDANVDDWIERFEGESREVFQERKAIVDCVGLREGMVVADIGAGTGLFTMPFADAVGSTGKVVAVDIVPEFMELIRKRAREQRLWQVQTVLCSEDSVMLAPGSIDVAFVCDTYHHFEYPKGTLASIHRALKPGGEMVIVDFERIPGQSRQWVVDHVRTGKETVIEEIRAAGFELVEGCPHPPELRENFVLRFRRRP